MQNHVILFNILPPHSSTQTQEDDIASLLASICDENGICSLANSIFLGCVSLEHVTLPKNTSDIPSSAFSGCPRLYISNLLE